VLQILLLHHFIVQENVEVKRFEDKRFGELSSLKTERKYHFKGYYLAQSTAASSICESKLSRVY